MRLVGFLRNFVLLIFVIVASVKICTQILQVFSAGVIHGPVVNISKYTSKPNKVLLHTEPINKIRVLFYTSVFQSIPPPTDKYEAFQQRFVFNNSLLHKEVTPKNGLEKNIMYRYKSHRYYLTKLLINGAYDVVVFHVKDAPGRRLLEEVGRYRETYPGGKSQLWAYYSKESPFNTINLIHGKYDGLFNLTITPNRDSDVFAPYGFYQRKNRSSDPWRIISTDGGAVIFNDAVFRKRRRNHPPPQSEQMRRQQGQTLLDTDLKFEEKPFLVAWLVSNCKQLRDYYVRRLLLHLNIHVYGKCAKLFHQNRKCLKNDFRCERLLRRYKFVLAFENSFCDDYITDKYWNALFRGNVPIVLGGSVYDEKVAIPGSYVNARSFKSSKELARYILRLSKKKYEYNKFVDWRKRYVLDYIPNDPYRLKYVLEKLYDVTRTHVQHKSYNLSTFYGRPKNCPLHTKEITIW